MKTYSNDFYKKAADYTANFEGFASKAYWDVNAYRIGYGSDTITLDTNGKFRKVVQEDITTKELAVIDLSRRIPEFFTNGVVKKIGSEYTDKLPETVLIALTSFAYNYGSIRKQNILDAARALDVQKIAEAVRAAQDDNNGVNKNRRNKEADFIKSAPPVDKSPTVTQNIISGTVRDDKGQPVAGATVKITQNPVKLSEPILNPTTGKYEVKDQNGNVIADSIDKEVARKQASNKVNSIVAKIIDIPTSLPKKTPTYVVYRKKEDGTTAPDGAIITFEESGPHKTAILTPVDPNISNIPIKGTPSFTATFDILANTVLGSYKDLLSSYYGSIVLEPGRIFSQPDSSLPVPPSPPTASKVDESPTTVTTDKDGNWQVTAPTTVDLGNSTVTFSKEGHEIREISNIQQTGGDIAGGEGKTYEVPRVLMPPTPDITLTATDKVNQEVLTEETALIKQQGNSELSPQEKLANMANNKKEEIKKTLIPFIIKLLAPFGAVALQAVISKIPLDKILNQVLCPNQAKILELINKRNKLVKQINNIYNTLTTLSKVLTGINIAITSIQAGILVLETLPYPATGVPPLGLPPLTSGIIETTGTGKDKLKEALKKANVVISIVTLSLAAFGAVLGIVLRLLNSLDALIQQCAQEQDIPFEAINTELNIFVNQSTGVSNSAVIASDNTYKGFALEIKLDEINTSKYPRRFAQALTKQGVPVLKTDSSFASDPQVLLDQLKFIIDSNPQLTAE